MPSRAMLPCLRHFPRLLLAILLSSSEASSEASPSIPLVLLPQHPARPAKCLDGSPAGYYVQPGADPRRWVIFLEGGGLCVEVIDCLVRSRMALGSSKNWSASYEHPDDFPFSKREGSFFRDFSAVFVPYCSGDLWLGTDLAPRLSKGELQMSGHFILEAVLDHLFNSSADFRTATDLVLSGASAGGVGSIQHGDWLSEKLKELGTEPRVSILALAGLFFPRHFPVLFEEFTEGVLRPLDAFMARYVHMFTGGFLHRGCTEAAVREKRKTGTCFDVSNVLPVLKAPLFILQNQFDALQIQDLGLCPYTMCKEGADPGSFAGQFIAYFGARMNDTLQEVMQRSPETGIFAPALFDHDGSLMSEVSGTGGSIGGASFNESFSDWYENRKLVHRIAASWNGHPCPHSQGQAECGVSKVPEASSDRSEAIAFV